MNVIDISSPQNMAIVHHFALDDAELTDVEVCGGHVFVTAQHPSNKQTGSVLVYDKYDRVRNTMNLIHDIPG